MKVKSVCVLRLVVFLPLSVATLADPDATFAFGVSTVAPDINSVVYRERTTTKTLVGESITGFDTARDFSNFRR